MNQSHDSVLRSAYLYLFTVWAIFSTMPSEHMLIYSDAPLLLLH